MVEKAGLSLELRVKLLLVILALACMLETSGAETPVKVTRRYSGDFYYLYELEEPVRSVCRDDNNLTYLVDEQRCVSNHELLNDRG